MEQVSVMACCAVCNNKANISLQGNRGCITIFFTLSLKKVNIFIEEFFNRGDLVGFPGFSVDA